MIDGQIYSNVSSTQGPFTLRGGTYQAAVVATFGGGSVKLQRVGPDGSTKLSVSSGTDFTANGCASVDLAPGDYYFLVTTATAVYAEIRRVLRF